MRSTHLGLFTYGEQIGFLLKCVVYFANAGKSLSLTLSHLSCTLSHELLMSQSVKWQLKHFHSSVSSLLENVRCVFVFRSCASADLNTHTSLSSLNHATILAPRYQGNWGDRFRWIVHRSNHYKVQPPWSPSSQWLILLLSRNYCLARITLIKLYSKWSEEAT